MTIDISNLPQHVILAVGERIVIPLPSYANSGNTWSATCLHGHGTAQLSIEVGELPVIADLRGDGISEPPPLMLAPEQAIVYGLVRGDAVWKLVLSRSFGPAETSISHDLQITVTDGSS